MRIAVVSVCSLVVAVLPAQKALGQQSGTAKNSASAGAVQLVPNVLYRLQGDLGPRVSDESTVLKRTRIAVSVGITRSVVAFSSRAEIGNASTC